MYFVWEWYPKEAYIKVPRDDISGAMNVASFLVLQSDSARQSSGS